MASLPGGRLLTVGLATSAALLALTGSAAANTPAQAGSRLVGSAGGDLDMPGWEGHPVRFAIDSRTAPDGNPMSAKGTFHVNHKLPSGKPFADFVGKVDCLAVGGKVAVATGTVTRADLPGLPGVDIVGRRVGFTVHDNGHSDRIGWSWALTGFDQDVPQCFGTAPFFKTTRGDLRVR